MRRRLGRVRGRVLLVDSHRPVPVERDLRQPIRVEVPHRRQVRGRNARMPQGNVSVRARRAEHVEVRHRTYDQFVRTVSVEVAERKPAAGTVHQENLGPPLDLVRVVRGRLVHSDDPARAARIERIRGRVSHRELRTAIAVEIARAREQIGLRAGHSSRPCRTKAVVPRGLVCEDLAVPVSGDHLVQPVHIKITHRAARGQPVVPAGRVRERSHLAQEIVPGRFKNQQRVLRIRSGDDLLSTVAVQICDLPSPRVLSLPDLDARKGVDVPSLKKPHPCGVHAHQLAPAVLVQIAGVPRNKQVSGLEDLRKALLLRFVEGHRVIPVPAVRHQHDLLRAVVVEIGKAREEVSVRQNSDLRVSGLGHGFTPKHDRRIRDRGQSGRVLNEDPKRIRPRHPDIRNAHAVLPTPVFRVHRPHVLCGSDRSQCHPPRRGIVRLPFREPSDLRAVEPLLDSDVPDAGPCVVRVHDHAVFDLGAVAAPRDESKHVPSIRTLRRVPYAEGIPQRERRVPPRYRVPASRRGALTPAQLVSEYVRARSRSDHHERGVRAAAGMRLEDPHRMRRLLRERAHRVDPAVPGSRVPPRLVQVLPGGNETPADLLRGEIRMVRQNQSRESGDVRRGHRGAGQCLVLAAEVRAYDPHAGREEIEIPPEVREVCKLVGRV